MSDDTRRQRLGKVLLLSIVAVVAFCMGAALAEANPVDPIDDWSAIGNQVIVVNGARAGLAQIDFAYVYIAIYDAVNAIDGGHSVFAVKPTTSPSGASPEAAVAAAAYNMLKWLFPAQAATLDGIYSNYLLGITDGPAKTRGIAVGTEVAQKFILLRTGDGRNAAVPYVFLTGPGQYQMTTETGTPYPGGLPAGTWVPGMKTFAIESATQYRADEPPSLTSETYASGLNETKAYGVTGASARTPEQTEIGRFYAENPGAQASRNIRNIAHAYHLSIVDGARFFAQMYVSMADAQITTWNSKYFYNFWRPVTAIRHADADDNPATDADPTWLPLVQPTPGHPEYPAAHPTVTGALAEALAHFFGTKDLEITLSSFSAIPVVPPAPPILTEHHFSNTDDIVKDVINGRIYGGMHYRFSGKAGAKIARQVSNYVARHYFKSVKGHNDNNSDKNDENDHDDDDDAQ
jgi:hypothetical protein